MTIRQSFSFLYSFLKISLENFFTKVCPNGEISHNLVTLPVPPLIGCPEISGPTGKAKKLGVGQARKLLAGVVLRLYTSGLGFFQDRVLI
jgi:hypothetical protein